MRLLSLALITLLYSCDSQPSGQIIKSIPRETPGIKDTASTVRSNWEYREQEDKMRSESAYFAQCLSTNTLDFDFPYDGGSVGSIIIRHMEKSNEVLIGIFKGQFASAYGDETVLVKFDDEKPYKIGFNEPISAQSNLIFLHSPANFIKKIRTSKKLMIEAQFYGDGRRVMEFDVSGLEWQH